MFFRAPPDFAVVFRLDAIVVPTDVFFLETCGFPEPDDPAELLVFGPEGLVNEDVATDRFLCVRDTEEFPEEFLVEGW